jgi:hypothetical protein
MSARDSQRILLEVFERAFTMLLKSGSPAEKRQVLKLLKDQGWADSLEIPPGESVEEFVRKAKARCDADPRTR